MKARMAFGLPSFKPREPRLAVSLSARIRAHERWDDARICNVSSRGLLIECTAPFRRGDVVEIRRGQVCVIARIVWTAENKFGVRSQDRIDTDDLIGAVTTQPRRNADGALVERRVKVRTEPANDHERSRALARAMQFFGLAGFAAGGAAMIALLLWTLLRTMTDAVSTALL
jgi:hypothetical protein